MNAESRDSFLHSIRFFCCIKKDYDETRDMAVFEMTVLLLFSSGQ